jgi:hypothetical protein
MNSAKFAMERFHLKKLSNVKVKEQCQLKFNEVFHFGKHG